MNIPLIMLIGYLAITTAVSLVFTKKNANAKQYFVAERSLGTVIIIAMLFSEIIAGAGTGIRRAGMLAERELVLRL